MAPVTTPVTGAIGRSEALHSQDRTILPNHLIFHREHVNYVSTQVRGHLRLPAVGKVDEIHNLKLATRNGAEVSDTLKYFSERIPATFVYAGINVAREGLFSGTRGQQIAGRFTMIPAAPFPCAAEWQGLVATLEGALRLHEHPPGTLTALDRYLHQRTGGMIGSLSHLIRGAAIEAILDGSEKITRKLLDAVDLDHAAQARPIPPISAAARKIA